MTVTIADVAELAKVSTSTVSLVLNNKGNIRRETREKIYEAIKKSGYKVKKYHNKTSKDENSKKIGILYNRSNGNNLNKNPFYSEIMEGVEDSLREHDFHIFFKTLSGDYDTDNTEVLQLIKEENLVGLILISYGISKRLITEINSTNLPLILVDNELWDENIDCVMCDNIRGAGKIVNYLIEKGHKKIAFISGPMSHTAINERYLGYIQALTRAGLNLNEDYIKICDKSSFFVDEGYHLMMDIMRCKERPTAIFAAADVLAIGAMKALHEMGYSVPKDFSVAGFDDIDMSQHIVPALSTVRIFKRELGNLAGKRLFELINGINSNAVKIIVADKMIIRDSIAGV